MSRLKKEIERLKTKPKDYTYDELKYLLNKFGFIEDNKGKTSGSRIEFKSNNSDKKIIMHRPHPGNIIKMYQINQVISKLEEWGVLK